MNELDAFFLFFTLSPFIIALVFIALFFDFMNGVNDAANSIATVVSTKVLSPRNAVLLASFFNFIAAFGIGVVVAKTIGKGIIDSKIVNEYLILAVLVGAILSVSLATYWGIPISVSHCLIGGLIGGGLAVGGVNVLLLPDLKIVIEFFCYVLVGIAIGIIAYVILKLLLKLKFSFNSLGKCAVAGLVAMVLILILLSVLSKSYGIVFPLKFLNEMATVGNNMMKGFFAVVVFMVVSPLLGLAFGFLFIALTMRFAKDKIPRKVDNWFRKLQLISASAYSFSHGTNDAQKTMGIIFALLISTTYFTSMGVAKGNEFVPWWVILSAHLSIALGTLSGGWRVIKTMGMRITKLKPLHGFSAETSSASVIIGLSIAGIPISTTHNIAGSIIGVGMTKRTSAVRWGVARNIIWAWILTIPFSAMISYLSYLAIKMAVGI